MSTTAVTAEGHFAEVPDALVIPQCWLPAVPVHCVWTRTAATDTEFSEIFTKSQVHLFLLPSHVLQTLSCIFLPFCIFLTFSFVTQSVSLRGWFNLFYCLQALLIFNLLAPVSLSVRFGFCNFSSLSCQALKSAFVVLLCGKLLKQTNILEILCVSNGNKRFLSLYYFLHSAVLVAGTGCLFPVYLLLNQIQVFLMMRLPLFHFFHVEGIIPANEFYSLLKMHSPNIFISCSIN